MTEYPPDDFEFEDHTLTAVSSMNNGGWQIMAGAMGFCCPPESPVVPKAGMIARYYGRGFGSVVRGLFIDWRRVFYRTEEQQRAHDLAELAKTEQRQRDDFERDRAALDARFDALPEVFRERIHKFRTTNPEFRWRFETYELFSCEEAVKIAEALKTPDAIKAFHGLNTFAEQRAQVPTISPDHSGNTFGTAVVLASAYVKQPGLVVLMHGALVPLVGCEAYGCPHPWQR